MLRKTNYQRDSMKRNTINITSPSMQSSYRNKDNLNTVYKSNDNRKDPLEWDSNEMISKKSKKYVEENVWDVEYGINDNSITTEIAPGIVIKGHVVEL